MSKADIVRNRIDHGLIPAVPVPFDVEGRLVASAQDCYARYMAKESIAGVAVWAHVGGFCAGIIMIKLFPSRPQRYRYMTWS